MEEKKADCWKEMEDLDREEEELLYERREAEKSGGESMIMFCGARR